MPTTATTTTATIFRDSSPTCSELVGDASKLSLGCDFHLSYDNHAGCAGQSRALRHRRFALHAGRVEQLQRAAANHGLLSRSWATVGITAVITHPERNPILRESLQRVVEWAEQGCVIQMTGSALTGFWGERVRRAAHWLLEHDAVHVLATDAHDTEKRIPVLSDRARCRRGNLWRRSCGSPGRRQSPQPSSTPSPCPTFPRPVLGKLPQDTRQLAVSN